jgi:hypothetical protein
VPIYKLLWFLPNSFAEFRESRLPMTWTRDLLASKTNRRPAPRCDQTKEPAWYDRNGFPEFRDGQHICFLI